MAEDDIYGSKYRYERMKAQEIPSLEDEIRKVELEIEDHERLIDGLSWRI